VGTHTGVAEHLQGGDSARLTQIQGHKNGCDRRSGGHERLRQTGIELLQHYAGVGFGDGPYLDRPTSPRADA
jgi:hypothetical protein